MSDNLRWRSVATPADRAVLGALAIASAALGHALVTRLRPRRRRRTESPARIPVAIVHDYLTQRGGAERVVLALTRAFPGAPVYTSLYDPAGTFPDFSDLDVRVSGLNRFRVLRTHHRLSLLLLPFTFSRLHVDADVVIASSSGWAHGVRTTGRLYVYCHSPARWLYQSRRYLGLDAPLAAKATLWLVRIPLRMWDRRVAQRPVLYIANSSVVRGRIVNTYRRDAVVLASPLPRLAAVAPATDPDATPGEAYYLCVSRLMPYKNVDIVIGAFAECPQRDLVVVGHGPDRERLVAMATANVTFVGEVDDEALATLYDGCTALVALSYEDFGLTPLEAAAAGRPSVVLRWGGYLDTMVEGVTAVFVDEPEPGALLVAFDALEARGWDAAAIMDRAGLFSEAHFIERIRRLALPAGVPSGADYPQSVQR